MKVDISKIQVGPRMRVDYGDLDELASSLSRLGQLQPIILDGDGDLVAGERRLKAAMMLGWKDIDAIYMQDLDEVGRKEVELEENLRRKEFTWPEEVLALEKLYNLKIEKYGSRTSGTDGAEGFGIKDAADEFDRSTGNISESLQLARALREFPNLAFEKTKSAAFKQWKRLREHRIRQEQAKRRNAAVVAADEGDDSATLDSLIGATSGLKAVEGPVPTPTSGASAQVTPLVKKAGFKGYGLMYRGDSEFILRNLPDAIVDCIVTDPPYALGMFGGDDQKTSGRRLAEHQGGMYNDDPHEVLDKLDKVVEQCARVLKPNGHMYMFFHHNWYSEIFRMLTQHFGEDHVEATPILWIKNTSGIGDPNERWVYSYEPFLFINRGRSLVKPQGHNYIMSNTVPKKTHPTEKPTMLLRQIIQASCVKGELVMDPYAGSGSTIIAALENGCKFYGMELDDVYYQRIVDRIALTIGTLEQQGPPAEPVDDSSSA